MGIMKSVKHPRLLSAAYEVTMPDTGKRPPPGTNSVRMKIRRHKAPDISSILSIPVVVPLIYFSLIIFTLPASGSYDITIA